MTHEKREVFNELIFFKRNFFFTNMQEKRLIGASWKVFFYYKIRIYFLLALLSFSFNFFQKMIMIVTKILFLLSISQCDKGECRYNGSGVIHCEEYILLALTFLNPTPISPFHFEGEEWNKAQSSFCVVKSLSCVPQKLQKLASFFLYPSGNTKLKS